ncbi:hypothetical protein [Xanthobacter pseudotagetidis]|uniref:hypothetical protein n=1 Tax=Xanthobacter pseudotagetidis TaxID=3119911 RepID=UPI003727146B
MGPPVKPERDVAEMEPKPGTRKGDHAPRRLLRRYAADGSVRGNAAQDGGDRQGQQPAYVARVSVRETGIETEQGFRPIEAGMAVTAEIKTGQRRLIEYLLSPILKYRHDFGRERRRRNNWI